MKLFKYISVLIFLLGSSSVVLANSWTMPGNEGSIAASAEENELRKNGAWYLYVEDAYAESANTGKPILANFTGSDWCGWCIRLKNEVFKTDKFLAWAEENVVLLELDFPRKKTMSEELRVQNSSLAQAFQITGYPTIWIFNLSFNETDKQFKIEALGKTGYVAGGAENWILSTNTILKKQAVSNQVTTKPVEAAKDKPKDVKEDNELLQDGENPEIVEDSKTNTTLTDKELKKQEKLDKKAAKKKAKAKKKLQKAEEKASKKTKPEE